MKKHFRRNNALPVQCVLICFALSAEGKAPSFTQPALPYAYNALEPYVDAMTMEIHYSRHHAAYTKNFNDALQALTTSVPSNIEDIFKNISKYPMAVRNNGGGYYNHILFWESMAPNAGGEPTGKLADAIKRDFGSFDAFKEQFAKAASTRFGSGWAWLISNKGKLSITSTPNQDNPLMDIAEEKGTPIFCIDVWEHAYYLKYQNKRPDYIQAFWNVANWKGVEAKYAKTL
ncbi:MAG: superoxide dismutase [Bacteroidales bacterium]|jgi:Fe-Mn family superoxide dismutase|nr:superoxide dismutase [Bacteroidales bacterium]